jgi:predicted dehydrogenase
MKVIQVGMGGMGNAWIRAVQRSSDVQFVGFVEVNEDIAKQQVATYGIDNTRVFNTMEDALDHLEVDGIINVTPPQFHKEISFVALDAGIPVLSEKPLAGTLGDSRMIVAKANETGVLHTITQNYRYSALAQTVKSVLDEGELGVVGSISVEFFKGPHFGGFREEMPYPLIIDMSIHHFDMMRFFLNSNPKQLYARSWNPAWSWYKGDASASVNVQFENGVPVNYIGSWCSQGMETTWNANWRFECEKGILTIEEDAAYIQRLSGIEERPGHHHTSNEEKEQVTLLTMEREAQDYLLHEFYEAVTHGKPTGTPAQDNIHTIEFVFGVVQASETGQVVNF